MDWIVASWGFTALLLCKESRQRVNPPYVSKLPAMWRREAIPYSWSIGKMVSNDFGYVSPANSTKYLKWTSLREKTE